MEQLLAWPGQPADGATATSRRAQQQQRPEADGPSSKSTSSCQPPYTASTRRLPSDTTGASGTACGSGW